MCEAFSIFQVVAEKIYFKLANLIFADLRKLRARKGQNVWNIKKASHFCALITKEHLAKFKENLSNLHTLLIRLKKGNPRKTICRRPMKQRFKPPERLATKILVKSLSHLIKAAVNWVMLQTNETQGSDPPPPPNGSQL